MASASRIKRMLRRHEAEMKALTARQARQFLSIYEQARKDLLLQLTTMEMDGGDVAMPFTAQRLRVMLAQVESGIRELQSKLGIEMAVEGRKQRDLALRQLVELIEAAEPGLVGAGPQINTRVLARIAEREQTALWRFSLERYSADIITAAHRQLVLGVAKGSTWTDMAKAVSGSSGQIAKLNGRGLLITRMEMVRAHNDATLDGIAEANELLDEDGDDPILKRVDAYMDARNHPISRALDGLTVPADEPFRVLVSEVKRHAAAMGKSLGGIVWAREGEYFVGANVPAHYNDRDRIVPHRASWPI